MIDFGQARLIDPKSLINLGDKSLDKHGFNKVIENTRCFYLSTHFHRRKNTITSLLNENKVWLKERNDIESHIINQFSNILRSS